MSNLVPDKLRIVAFQDGNAWVAQCVDYDIAVQASDLTTLKCRMEAVLHAEAAFSEGKGEAPFSTIDPAPDYYESVWLEGAGANLQSEAEFRIAA